MALNTISRDVQRVETRCYNIHRAYGSYEKIVNIFIHQNLMPTQNVTEPFFILEFFSGFF
jgi:hypothetical protein